MHGCAHAARFLHLTVRGRGSVVVMAVIQPIVIVMIGLQAIVMPYADEVGGVVRHARSTVLGRLWVRTKRSRAAGREILGDAGIEQSAAWERGGGIVIGCDDTLRRDAVLDPGSDGSKFVDREIVCCWATAT